MKIIFLSFDDAKVRRFLQSAMDYHLLLHKKRISFDVNQLIVREHMAFVCENSLSVTNFLAKRFRGNELQLFPAACIAEKKMAVLWLRFLTEINERTKTAPAELLENEPTVII